MTTSRSRQFVTLLLVVGAVVFGMVLAGGLELTAAGHSDTVARGPAEVAVGGGPAAATPGFADLAEAVGPAVVSIDATTIETTPQRRQMVDPFEFFFGPRRRGEPEQEPQQQQQQPERFRSEAGGSGFLISGDGLIVTNNHVVRGASQLTVHYKDRDYKAEVKGTDPATDLALLKIDAGSDLPYLKLGDSDKLRVGDWVMVIGSPLALDHTVTVGVVSAKGRALGISDVSFENFIQTDAAINFGNSGGPLVNLRGEVVGIATAINYGAENIGFAVPVSTLEQVLPQLEEKGKVSRGYLGIEIRNLDYPHAQAFGLSSTDGALVESVTDDSPAKGAGVTHGDVIVGVDEQKVKTTRDLIDYVAAKPPGTTVALDVVRNGKHTTVKVKLTERPGTQVADEGEGEPSESGIDWLGINYQGLDAATRQNHGIPADVNGVWVTRVEPDSPLVDVGVQAGDVIAEVNGTKVTTVAEFEKAVGAAASGSYLRLYVQRFDPRSDRAVSFFAPVKKP
jgi:serine protease Do